MKEKPQVLECEESCMEGSVKRPWLVIRCCEAAVNGPEDLMAGWPPNGQ